MNKIFVDSNIFLRFFTSDEQKQHEQAANLFKNANLGKVELICGPPVLFEIAWTLKSAYNLSNKEIIDVLSDIIAFKGLTLIDGDLVEEAVHLAKATGQEFADAYIWATCSKHQADVATFNVKHFDKLGANMYPFNS